eukprot:9472659-Pyramimonas_sp.AAC.1
MQRCAAMIVKLAPRPDEEGSDDSGHGEGGDDDQHDEDSDAPPPPPPPPPGGGGGGTAPDGRIHMICDDGSQIRYYPAEKPFFEFVCHAPGHGKCVLTRTAKQAARGGRRGQGRPLGLGAAWLSNSGHPDHASHMTYRPTAEQRYIARQGFRARYGALFTALEEKERDRRDGEASEPSDIN